MQNTLLAAMADAPLPDTPALTPTERDRLHTTHTSLRAAINHADPNHPLDPLRNTQELTWRTQALAEAATRPVLARRGDILGNNAPYARVIERARVAFDLTPRPEPSPTATTSLAAIRLLDLLAELADAPHRPDTDLHLATLTQAAITWTHHVLANDLIYVPAPDVAHLESGRTLSKEQLTEASDIARHRMHPTGHRRFSDAEQRRLGVAVGRYDSTHGCASDNDEVFYLTNRTVRAWTSPFLMGLAHGLFFSPDETIDLTTPEGTPTGQHIEALIGRAAQAIRLHPVPETVTENLADATTDAVVTADHDAIYATYAAMTEEERTLPEETHAHWRRIKHHLIESARTTQHRTT